jgi:transposase
MPRTRRPYPPEFRLEAVRMLRTGVRSPKQLAEDLGCSAQTLRNWVRQDEADQSERQDLLSSEEWQRLRELEQPRLDPARLLRTADTQPSGTRCCRRAFRSPSDYRPDTSIGSEFVPGRRLGFRVVASFRRSPKDKVKRFRERFDAQFDRAGGRLSPTSSCGCSGSYACGFAQRVGAGRNLCSNTS